MPNELSYKDYPDGTKAYFRDDAAREQIANLINVIEKNITSSTSGHSNPTQSDGGAYYEYLISYNELGVPRDKILSVEIIGWGSLKKSFTLYLGGSGIAAITDSASSVYALSNSYMDLRIVYKS